MSAPQIFGKSGSVTGFDILLLLLLAAIWGTVFAFWKITLASIPPLTTAAVRVGIATVILLIYLRLTGRRLPRGGKLWLYIFATSCAGLVVPFSLIGWGQQFTDTAVAAICMASVPLYTLPLAHLLTADEKLTLRKLFGMLTGFAGVVLLFLSRMDDNSTLATSGTMAALGILAILFGAFSYAVEGLMIRRLGTSNLSGASEMDGMELTTALLAAATACLLPLSLILDHPWTLRPTTESVLSLLYLGFGGSAVAMAVMVTLIQRVGATITSLNNYLVPLIGVFTGILWMNESLLKTDAIACALILLGIGVTSWRQNVAKKLQKRA